MAKLPFAINGAKLQGSLGGGVNVSSFAYILDQGRNSSTFKVFSAGKQCLFLVISTEWGCSRQQGYLVIHDKIIYLKHE
ncbi:hypothetical protein COR50_15210 [Chitinophaga caeni]|uniref:Uncharacterized protein n=1 Tax=Chitinophaga caeni TaxID=2029983 RepID=A0A291QX09_9BACT|nr:hypothetical protein COR50_15210 [Chitinophaga caeni]